MAEISPDGGNKLGNQIEMRQNQQGKRLFYGWYILAGCFTALFVTFGSRFTFGLFFKDILQEFSISRAELSLAVSISTIVYGLTQPLVGNLLDRYGPRAVFGLSGAVLALGLVGMGLATATWQLYIIYGLVMGVGFGGLAFVTVSATISRWFVRRKGMAIGIATSGASVGQFVLVPLAALVLLQYGWRVAQISIGILVFVVIIPLSLWVIKKSPAMVGCGPDGGPLEGEGLGSSGNEPRPQIPSQRPLLAFRTRAFWKLSGTFFVCGFTSLLVSTHLAAYVTDLGYSQVNAAFALALLGGVNFLGVIGIGSISDKIGRRLPLSAVYFVRGLSFLLLLNAENIIFLYLFVLVFGLSWMATVPLTSAMVAEIFGPAYLGTIFGAVSFGHQVGGALGSFLAGFLFDLTGSYFAAFMMGLALCMAASIFAYLLNERPLQERVQIPGAVEPLPTRSFPV